MQKLSGKTAVITGGNSGIGFAAAQAFVAEGARVVIVGRRRQAVDEAVAQLGASAFGVVGDVGDLSTHDRLLAEVRGRSGAIDVYMANAGMNHIEPSPAVSVDSYDAQFATNTRAVFFGVTKALPLMRDGASIILTGSIASAKVLENHAVYAGSKAAIGAFARAWALEFKKDTRQRAEPGPHRHPHPRKTGRVRIGPPRFRAGHGLGHPPGTPGAFGRAGARRRIPGFGRQQFRHRSGPARRWRDRADVRPGLPFGNARAAAGSRFPCCQASARIPS